MDEGLPIAYGVLETGIPVYTSDGEMAGTVDQVIAATAQDIFHGLVVRVGSSRRFVSADQVASLHERGVDLRIDAGQVATLPEPDGSAPTWHVHEPGVKPSRWTHLLDRVSGKRGDWTKDG